MKPKLFIDISMTIAMLLLMTYGMVGEELHEWLGIGIFALFLIHHILNRRWYRTIGRGRYTPIRIVQTLLVGLIFLCVAGLMVSGIILSRYVFAALPIRGGYEIAEKLHILCSYWGFVLMGLHLGFYWNRVLAVAGMHLKPNQLCKNCLRCLAFVIAGYGMMVFFRRDIGIYLLLKSHFVFFDYSESVIHLLCDYAALMGLFVFCGFYASKCIKKL